MAGPWFTVVKSGSDWQTVSGAWLSNGCEHERVRVELRVRLEEEQEEEA